MLCRICVVQIEPTKLVLDRADYTALTRQHELDHTDRTDPIDHTDQECIYLLLKDLDNEVGVDHTDHVSEVCLFFTAARSSGYVAGIISLQVMRDGTYTRARWYRSLAYWCCGARVYFVRVRFLPPRRVVSSFGYVR